MKKMKFNKNDKENFGNIKIIKWILKIKNKVIIKNKF